MRRQMTWLFLVTFPLIAFLLFLILPLVQDAKAWSQASEQDSVEGYLAYLQKFPDGKHAEDAREAYDDEAWHAALMINSPEAFESYLRGPNGDIFFAGYSCEPDVDCPEGQYPWFIRRYYWNLGTILYNGRHILEAEQKLDELHWQQAVRSDTYEAYRFYVTEHQSNGQHLSEAIDRLHILEPTAVPQPTMNVGPVIVGPGGSGLCISVLRHPPLPCEALP